MARPKKLKGLPSWLIGLILLLVATAAYFTLRQNSAEASLRTVEELNFQDYCKDANSLRGNTYKIDAEVVSALGNSPSKGRLFSVQLSKGGQNGEKAILPVLVPLELGDLNVQKGQHYLMKVKVVENGLLKVETARKP